MTAHSVYWIRKPEHTDMFSEGYIGVSKNWDRRMIEHSRSKNNVYLANVIAKYGWDALVKTQILVGDEDYCLEIEAKLRPTDKIGWNLVRGGGKPPLLTGPREVLKGRVPWNKGKKMPESTVEKVRAAVRRQMQDPVQREKFRLARLGKPSPRKGVKLSEELKAKMGASKRGKPSKKKGIPVSAEAYANTVAAARIVWECPHCHKIGMSKGAANRWHFDNCKMKAD